MWPLTRLVGADPATGPKEAEKPGRRGQNWSQCHFAAARTLGEWRRRPQALSSLRVTRPQACRTGRSRCADRQQLSLAQALPPLRGAPEQAPRCALGPRGSSSDCAQGSLAPEGAREEAQPTVAAAQDLPEPAASGEKDQMGLARPLPAGLRPHCPWPVVRPRTLHPRPPMQA